MSIDKNKVDNVINTLKKGMRVKTEIERTETNRKRVYELSRSLPSDEGFELIEIYEQAIIDARKIQRVRDEK